MRKNMYIETVEKAAHIEQHSRPEIAILSHDLIFDSLLLSKLDDTKDTLPMNIMHQLWMGSLLSLKLFKKCLTGLSEGRNVRKLIPLSP